MNLNPANALNRIKGAFRSVVETFRPLFRKTGEDTPTLRELRLDADEFVVMRKLGHSFFTRGISVNTRNARLASLTQGEYMLAKARGWTR